MAVFVASVAPELHFAATDFLHHETAAELTVAVPAVAAIAFA